MRRSRSAPWLLSALLALAPLGAAQDLRGFSLVYRSRTIDFYARQDAPVRPSDGDRAEDFLAALRRRLGRGEIPQRVSYYRVGHRAEVRALLGREADGAAFPGRRVVSVHPDNRHELVHVALEGLGSPGHFFQEGVAVALAQERGWSGRDLRRRALRAPLRVRDALEWFEGCPPEHAYAVAGAFVEHLIRGHGLQALVRFFAACDGRPASREAAFREAFGLDLDAAAQRWRAQG